MYRLYYITELETELYWYVCGRRYHCEYWPIINHFVSQIYPHTEKNSAAYTTRLGESAGS